MIAGTATGATVYSARISIITVLGLAGLAIGLGATLVANCAKILVIAGRACWRISLTALTIVASRDLAGELRRGAVGRRRARRRVQSIDSIFPLRIKDF